MATDDDLDAAAGAGIITADQARDLKRFLATREEQDAAEPTTADMDAESVRFARGFHDVFLTIGLIILMVGLVSTASLVIGSLAGFLGAVVAWLLAEYYARTRMLVLPSIALCVGFVLMVAFAVTTLGATGMSGDIAEVDERAQWWVLAGGIAAIAASGAFLYRFRLPFAYGALATSAAVTLFTLAALAAPDAFDDLIRPLIFVAGMACFSAAMIFDFADPGRTTLKSDNAFWLHLAAAPMIVHSVVGGIAGEAFDLTVNQAVSVFAVLFLLGVVALVIDRRAILVAGLVYLGVAIAVLVAQTQVDTGSVTAVTLLLLGAAVAGLGTGWRPARRFMVETIVPARLAAALPTIRSDPGSGSG